MDSKLRIKLSALSVSLILAACTPKSVDDLVADAQRFADSGQNDAAIIELKNAVAQDPGSASTRAFLGKLYFETGQLDAADKELTRARELGASDDEVVPLLSKVYFHSGRFNDIVLLARDANVNDPQGKGTLALFNYIAQVRTADDTIAAEVAPLVPQLSESDLQIAQAYEALYGGGQLTEAQIEAIRSDSERSMVTDNLAGLFFYQKRRYVDAANAFQQQLAALPVVNSASFYLVDSLISSGQMDKAKAEADKLYAINKEQPYVNFYKARIAFAEENYEEALAFADKAVQNGLDNKSSRTIAAISAYSVRQYESAYRHLTAIQADDPNDQQINRLMAQVQIQLGYSVDAQQTLDTLGDLSESDAMLLSNTGMLSAIGGDAKVGRELLQKAKSLDPENPSIQLNEAFLSMVMQEDSSVDALKAVLDKDKSVSRAWIYLAIAHANNGELEQALNVAREWQEVDPVQGKVLEGMLFRKAGEPEKAIAPLTSALQEDPKHLGGHLHLIQIYDALGDNESLYDIAHKAQQLDEDNRLAMTALVKAAARLGSSDSVIAELKKRNGDKPDNVDIAVGLATAYRSVGRVNDAIDTLERYRSRLTNLGYMQLGDAYLLSRQLSEAEDVFKQWRDSQPENLLATLRYIGAKQLGGQIDTALLEVNSAISTFGEVPELNLLKLDYLTKLHRTDDAQVVLDVLKQQKIDSDKLAIYEGNLALAQKDWSKAEQSLAVAYENTPAFNVAVQRARALIALAQTDKATQVMETGFENSTKTPIDKHRLAEFFVFTSQFAKAEALYADIVENTDGDFLAWNNLANAQLNNGNGEAAKTSAEKALELSPNHPSLLDTMGRIEFTVGNLQVAEQYLSLALNKQPENEQIKLHLAETLLALGQKRRAGNMLRELNGLNSKDRQKRDALLQSIN